MIKSKYDSRITPTTNNILMLDFIIKKINEVYAVMNAAGINVAELLKEIREQKEINAAQQTQINLNTKINEELQQVINDPLSEEDVVNIWGGVFNN